MSVEGSERYPTPQEWLKEVQYRLTLVADPEEVAMLKNEEAWARKLIDWGVEEMPGLNGEYSVEIPA